jgi:Domain of unknown function (DUF4430)
MLRHSLALCLILAPSLALANGVTTKPWVPATVSLEIKKPDDSSTVFADVPWSIGITVLELMQSVDGLKFSGEWNRQFSDWLVTSIDGQISPGAAGENWLYCLNGFPAGAGVSSTKLGPGAKVKWVFTAKYPPDCT